MTCFDAILCIYVSFYNTIASTWTLATPRTTWESLKYIEVINELQYIFLVRYVYLSAAPLLLQGFFGFDSLAGWCDAFH